MFSKLKLLALMALPLLAGCEETNLYVTHHTVVGLDVAVNSQQTSGHLIFGYDRNSLTIIPVSVDAENIKELKPKTPAKGGDQKNQPDGMKIERDIRSSGGQIVGKEAMSALSCSEVEVDGIFLTGFSESLATGNAALLLAKNLGNNDDVFPCFKDK